MKSLLPTLIIVVSALTAETLCAATPLLDYNFNANSTTQASSGSITDNVVINGGSATIGADGSGVSGLSGDRAFVTGNGGMGANQSPFTGKASGNADIPALTAFTATGWFNASTILANSAVLFRTDDGAIIIKADAATAGSMNLVIGASTSGRSSAAGLFNQTNTWVFFAVTYDGSNVSFYQGKSGTSVSQLGSSVAFTATMSDPAAGITIGNNTLTVASDARPFAGSLDDIRLFNGVLNSTELESIRVADLANTSIAIPEPSSVAAWLGGAGILVAACSRRRARRSSGTFQA